VGTDVKTKSKGEATGTEQETVGMEHAATQSWSSAFERGKADRDLELKFKSQRGEHAKEWLIATYRRLNKRRSKEAQPTITYIDGCSGSGSKTGVEPYPQIRLWDSKLDTDIRNNKRRALRKSKTQFEGECTIL
jgi:hypothetical protein